MPIKTPFRNMSDLENSLEDLLDDIHHLGIDGERPTETFANAPLLQDWSLAAMGSPCLVGSVSGHPLLGNRRRIHTSQLMYFDVEQNWARTWSRYYRLGKPNVPSH